MKGEYPSLRYRELSFCLSCNDPIPHAPSGPVADNASSSFLIGKDRQAYTYQGQLAYAVQEYLESPSNNEVDAANDAVNRGVWGLYAITVYDRNDKTYSYKRQG